MPNIHKRTTDRGLVTQEIIDFLPSSVTDRPLQVTTVPSENADPTPSTSRQVEATLNSPSPSIQTMSTEDLLPLQRDLNTPTPSTKSPLLASPAPPVMPIPLRNSPELIMAPMALPSTTVPDNSESDNLPIPSTSSASIQDVTTTFSPYVVKPLPKAGPRKNNGKGRKCRKTAIMTDTPNKLEIQDEEERKTRSKVVKKPIFQMAKDTRKGKPSAVKKTIKKKAQKKKNSGDSDDDDCFCLVCVESFSNSRPSEKWVQCLDCKRWAHVECTKNELSYVCHNCLSD